MQNDLTAEAVTRGLNTRFIGQNVLYYQNVTSTMALAKEEALAGAAEGTVVLAEEQSAGRGRLERRWVSPPGCIALSVVLYPQPSELPSLIMVASLAVANAIEAITGLKPGIKWPNDVRLNGKKVCGILVDSGQSADGKTYAVIGIGINANVKAADIGPVLQPATSLYDELGSEISRLEIVRQLLTEIERLYLSLKEGDEVYRQWRYNLETLGKRVSADAGDIVFEGLADDVDEDGHLAIILDDGSLIFLAAGDVTLQG